MWEGGRVSGRGGEVSQLRHRGEDAARGRTRPGGGRGQGEDAASGRVASLAAYCTVTRDGEGEGVQ